MTLHVAVVPGSATTIHRQIVEQVCAAIFAGDVGDDEPLPSVRALAEQLVVNHNTVARAYAELVREGVLESRAGRGMFVSKRRQIYSRAERNRRFEESATSFVTNAILLGFEPKDIIDRVSARIRALKPDGRSGTEPSQRGKS